MIPKAGIIGMQFCLDRVYLFQTIRVKIDKQAYLRKPGLGK